MRFPTYTTPFIVTTWALYFVGLAMGAVPVQPAGPPVVAGFAEAVAHGIGQVMFQGSVWTALFFVIGIAINDWEHALWVVVASMIGMLVGIYHHESSDEVAALWAIRLQRNACGCRPVPVAAFFDSATTGNPDFRAPHRDLPDGGAAGLDGSVRTGDLDRTGSRMARSEASSATRHRHRNRGPRRPRFVGSAAFVCVEIASHLESHSCICHRKNATSF